MEKEQVYQNLGAFIGCYSAQPGEAIGNCPIPNQFLLGGGQAQVSNQIQGPNIANNLTGGPFFKSAGVQGQNQWTQSWSITPVTDFSDLQRLRALYAYTVALSAPGDSSSVKALQDFSDFYAGQIVKGIDPCTANAVIPKYFNDQTTTTDNKGQNQSCVSQNQRKTLLPLPLPDQARFTPLPDHKWVFWNDDKATPDAVYVGEYSGHKLSVDQVALNKFLIWVIGATPNTAGGGAGSGGGGGKGAGKSGPSTSMGILQAPIPQQ
jgi:hypothetical protein